MLWLWRLQVGIFISFYNAMLIFNHGLNWNVSVKCIYASSNKYRFSFIESVSLRMHERDFYGFYQYLLYCSIIIMFFICLQQYDIKS